MNLNNKAMEPRFDIHLHLFNKTFLAKELYFRLIQVIHQLFEPDKKIAEKGIFDTLKNKLEKIKSIIQAIRRINSFLHVGFRSDSTEVCDELNQYYKNEFILTPLMFDLTYCFVSSAIGTKGLEKPVDYFKILEKQKNTFLKKVELISPPVDKGNRAITPKDKRKQKLLTELEKELKEFKTLTEELKKSDRKDAVRKRALSKDLDGIPGEADGFREQILQLKVLKASPKYRERIFPFLAVDPRRPGILEYMKANVGKGKPFIGVKLYNPNGYSPTDPQLYGSAGNNDCVYSFCEKNKIPVTAHNSYGGFATFMDSIEITGDVYTAGGIKQMHKELYNFHTKLVNEPGKAIKERALLLNHPSLWEKVLQKYPYLYLDLAHFGGGERLGMALDNIDDQESGNWSKKIIDLIQKYPNAFTDISCFSEFDVLRKLIASSIYNRIKTKIMYGSDFYLLLLFENDFKKNIQSFRTIFSADFDLISRDNPKKYLANVL
jgi:predicted TIM-barrel fold metal-dependent hydrolase